MTEARKPESRWPCGLTATLDEREGQYPFVRFIVSDGCRISIPKENLWPAYQCWIAAGRPGQPAGPYVERER